MIGHATLSQVQGRRGERKGTGNLGESSRVMGKGSRGDFHHRPRIESDVFSGPTVRVEEPGEEGIRKRPLGRESGVPIRLDCYMRRKKKTSKELIGSNALLTLAARA